MQARDDTQNDSLRATLRTLIDDAERVMGELGDEGSRRYRQAVRSLDRQLSNAREDLDDLHHTAMRRARASVRRADVYAHEHPYRISASAAATGLLIGAVIAFLLTRR
ncbi:MAG: hypothetical protein U1F41_12160 [Burkholderiales bacterium]